MRELSEIERSQILNKMQGMRADELICAVSAIPTTVLAQELERRSEQVFAIVTNVQALCQSLTSESTIQDYQKTIMAIQAVTKSSERYLTTKDTAHKNQYV